MKILYLYCMTFMATTKCMFKNWKSPNKPSPCLLRIWGKLLQVEVKWEIEVSFVLTIELRLGIFYQINIVHFSQKDLRLDFCWSPSSFLRTQKNSENHILEFFWIVNAFKLNSENLHLWTILMALEFQGKPAPLKVVFWPQCFSTLSNVWIYFKYFSKLPSS